MSLSPQFLDELRARTLLSALLGRTLKLQRAGREWKACCPFHNEKTPSFTVNDDKGFYHCFGCGTNGDAIRWMTEARGLTFIDAVKELADAAGLDMPAPDPRAQEREDQRKPLFVAMERAISFYAGQRDVRAVQIYLDQRRISPATASAFNLGFAPDGGNNLRAALQDLGDELLLEAGLLVQPEDDRAPYDRFRARLIFPIRDQRGRAIALGGRILGKGEPKYLNSPDTPLFDKGRSLFNIDRAAPAARKVGRLVVVEGYMDVIGLADAGIEEVVAPNGTAVTEAQLELMWRLAETPIMCFDGDGAGNRAIVKAALRALPFLEPGRSLQFVTMPEGQDPDDIVRGGGTAAMEELLGRARSMVDLIWQHETAEPIKTPEARAGLKQRLGQHAAAIKNANVRQQYLAEFKQRFDRRFAPAPARQVSDDRGRFNRRSHSVSDPARSVARGGMQYQLERAILAGLLRFPDLVGDMAEALAAIRMEGDHEFLRNLLLDAAMNQELTAAKLPAMLAREGMGHALTDLRRGHRLPFSFVNDAAEDDRARTDLAAAIDAQARR